MAYLSKTRFEWLGMKNMMETNRPITEAQLIEFEQYIGAKLPEEYRKFLLDCNGGYPDWSCSIVPEENVTVAVCELYGIGNTENDLKWIYDNYEGLLPDGFIPIGCDPGGNEIVIGLSDSEHEGQVFF